MPVPFDSNQADLFLRLMYTDTPGVMNICYITTRGGDLRPGEFFTTDDLGIRAAIAYAQDLAKRSFASIYLRTTTLKERPAWGRGYAKDTAFCAYGWADIDFGSVGHKGEKLPPDAESAYRLVAEAGLPEPTLWIFSGGGWYPIWKWSRALSVDTAKELVERIQKLLVIASAKHGWGYGSGVKDMARVLRLAGSSNMKTHLPRACYIVHDRGTGMPVDLEAFPPAPDDAVVRAIDPTAVRPPKKSTAEYVPGGPKKAFDVMDDLVSWDELLADYGLHEVGGEAIARHFVRQGSSSKYSAKLMYDTDSLVVWSEALDDLPRGVGLKKAAFLAYTNGFGGDRSELLKAILSGETTAGLDADVIEAMKNTGNSVTVVYLRHGDVPTPEQFMRGDRVMYVDEDQIVTDTDVDTFIDTFTRNDRPSALFHRKRWAAADGPARLPRHAYLATHEAVLGRYPAADAVRLIVEASRQHGVDPDSTVKSALSALLQSNVSA